MLEIYAKGVSAMKALSGGDPRSWTFQWFTHWVRGDSDKLAELASYFGSTPSPAKDLANLMWSSCQAHDPAMNAYNFLPWHRASLLYFEEIVRSVTGSEEFTLPYWDYTIDGVLPEEFRRPGDSLWGVLFVDERRPQVNSGTTIKTNAVNLNALRNPSYYDSGLGIGFNNQVDGGIHGAVHVNVGTTQNMGSVPFAARDPIFWLHHCNIDRMWASWNGAGRTNPSDTAWLEAKHVFADRGGNRVEISNGDLSDLSKLGYSYDSLPPAPVSPTAGVTILAQAAEPLARNSQTIKLGGDITTASLAILSPASSASLASLGEARLLLVLDGIRAVKQPGTVFDVYASVPGQPPSAGVYVGSVNFFDAVPIAEGARKPKRAVFDVTEALTQASLQISQLDVLTYHFVPTDPVAPDAEPIVERVELVKEASRGG